MKQATIPNRLYKIVDWHLRHEKTLLADAQKEAAEIKAQALGTKGGHCDPTANTVLEITKASDLVEKAALWLSVIEESFSALGYVKLNEK